MKLEDLISLLGKLRFEVVRAPIISLIAAEAVEEESDDLLYIDFPYHGLQLRFDGDRRLTSIFLEVPRAPERLGVILPWLDSRPDLAKALGEPDKSGAQKRFPDIGIQGAWDRWDLQRYSIHAQYLPDSDRIARITLMDSLAVPGR